MAHSVRRLGESTFSSLRIRNYRLYYSGQVISNSGTWMQSIAQAWLVLNLTNSGTALGLISALQSLPVLLFGTWGGVIADRFPKRQTLIITQTLFGLLALGLGILVWTDTVQLWMVAIFAFCLGMVNVIDNPTRQSFVVEMVGEAEIKNAVTLFSMLVNLSRIIGPSLAGILIAAIGLAPCYIVNGLSYAAVVIMLLVMRPEELRPATRLTRARGQVSAGLHYVWTTPVLRDVLFMIALIGTLTYEFQVSLPLLARVVFDGDASSYAALSAALGLGAVAGGLLTAGRKHVSFRTVAIAALLFGLAALATTLMPTLPLAMAGMTIVGFWSITFSASGNTTLQLNSIPQMRGRVMSLWTMAFLGSTTIGAPAIGFIGQQAGAEWALGTGGLAAVVAGVYGLLAWRRRSAQPGEQAPAEPGAS